jgi:hypothetical protein
MGNSGKAAAPDKELQEILDRVYTTFGGMKREEAERLIDEEWRELNKSIVPTLPDTPKIRVLPDNCKQLGNTPKYYTVEMVDTRVKHPVRWLTELPASPLDFPRLDLIRASAKQAYKRLWVHLSYEESVDVVSGHASHGYWQYWTWFEWQLVG